MERPIRKKDKLNFRKLLKMNGENIQVEDGSPEMRVTSKDIK
jgi:hypothetical protein